MLSNNLQNAINEQIKNELYSAYLYLAMAAWSEERNLGGFAHWMRVQAREETGHALKFFGYVHDRGGKVVLQAIEQPPSEFTSSLTMFQQTLEHEQKVTALINNLYKIAVQDNDYASQAFLQWFVNEQVEEEKSATGIIEILKMAGSSGPSLLMANAQLGARGAH